MADFKKMCLQMKKDKIEEILVKCESCGKEINPFMHKFCGRCGAKNEHYIKMDTPEEIREEWNLKQKQEMENLKKFIKNLKEEINILKRKDDPEFQELLKKRIT